MKPLTLSVVLAVLVLWPVPAFPAGPDALAATSGTVSGKKIQQVGFRAMILKQAIQFNLAGKTENHLKDKVETVTFVLQGDPDRIKAALKVIAKGTPKSSKPTVKTAKKPVDPKLHTFTIIDWTSSSRNITTKYNLVFTQRKKDKTVSDKDAKKEFNQILKKTLKKEDFVRVQLKEIEEACMVYKLKEGAFPKTLAILTKGSKAHLHADDLIDPWKKPYQYNPAGPKHDGTNPDIWTVTPDKMTIGNWK